MPEKLSIILMFELRRVGISGSHIVILQIHATLLLLRTNVLALGTKAVLWVMIVLKCIADADGRGVLKVSWGGLQFKYTFGYMPQVWKFDLPVKITKVVLQPPLVHVHGSTGPGARVRLKRSPDLTRGLA